MELGFYTLVGSGVALVVALLVGLYFWHRASRDRLYAELAAKRGAIIIGHEPRLAPSIAPQALRDSFQRDHIVRVDYFVAPDSMETLRAEAKDCIPLVERSYVPTHKQGGTVSYEKIHYHAPNCLAFYHSPAVLDWISQVIGEKVVPTADHDQSSCSLLCYTQEGDHINWHFDHNFYAGRHFTVLLSLVNVGAEGGASKSQLMHRDPDGTEHVVDTGENSLVIFEGDHVLHKASQLGKGDTRVLLSFTLSTDPRIGWFQDFVRRVKDTAFYGVRTLWD